MRIILTGDTHSSWKYLYKMLELEKPHLLIHCGDWGTHMDDRIDFERFIQKAKLPIITVYGNHDDLDQITNYKAPNYHWLKDFEILSIKGIRFMGINGNVAGNPRHPWHYTENLVRGELRNLLARKKHDVDFIVSHECPRGYGDILKSRERHSDGRHIWKKNAGWQSLAEVLEALQPSYWLCGHLHYQQIAQYKETLVLNAGYGAVGRYILLDTSKNHIDQDWLSIARRVKMDETQT